MRKILALLLGLGACASPPATVAESKPPAAIATTNVPAVSSDLMRALEPYQAVKGASFGDWLPDGRGLVFSRRAGSTSQLHIAHYGGAVEQLTRFDEPVGGGAVAAGWNVIFSMSAGGDENNQIWRMNLHDRKPQRLTDGTSRHQLMAMNRAKTLAVVGVNRRGARETDLFVMDLATGGLDPLLETRGQSWSAADWSPDDRKILLLHYVSANESYPHVMDVTTRKVTPIPIPGGGKASHDAFAFASNDAVYLSSDAGREFQTLARVDLATMRYTWLTEDIPWDVDAIDVDGDRAVFVANHDGASRVYLLEAGRRTTVDLPLALVGGIELTGQKLAFTLSAPDAPSDVATIESGRLVRWKLSDVAGLDASRFVVPERHSVASFDGTTVPFYVYRPLRAGKAPVIFNIHGGPEGQYRPSFGGLTQYYVSELGCAVIGPNVRGSSGYGKTYLAADNAEKREDSVKDIGAILDWIAKQPDLDASRVCVTGGSYGGYMVLASLVHYGDRLRAGVDIVGIANFTTFLKTTSAYRQDLRRAEYGDERDPKMQAVFERISPSNHAEKITSALLVAHGRNDPRVPFGEAQLIASKAKGPVWTVYAANEGHGFGKKENRDYLNAATVLFFREFLLK